MSDPETPVRPLPAKPRYKYLILILKPHGQSSRSPVRLLLSKVKLSYIYYILKPNGQSSKSPFKLLPCEAITSYVCTILKTSHPQSQSQAVVCVSTPRMYLCSGYFLVFTKKGTIHRTLLLTNYRMFLILGKSAELLRNMKGHIRLASTNRLK